MVPKGAFAWLGAAPGGGGGGAESWVEVEEGAAYACAKVLADPDSFVASGFPEGWHPFDERACLPCWHRKHLRLVCVVLASTEFDRDADVALAAWSFY